MCDFLERSKSRDNQRIRFSFISKQNRSNSLDFRLTSWSSPFSSCSCFVLVFVFVAVFAVVVVVVVVVVLLLLLLLLLRLLLLLFLSVCRISSSYSADLPGIFSCSLQEYHCNVRRCTTLFYKDLQKDPSAANCG